MSRAEYFPGCHDVPLIDLPAADPPVLGPLTPYPPTPSTTLADAIEAAERRRRADDGQLTLPAELMPVPAGALFA